MTTATRPGYCSVSSRGARAGLGLVLPLGLLCAALLPRAAAAGEAKVYLAAPEMLKSGDRWEIEVERKGKDATLTLRGHHPGKETCVQKPYLKVRYNAKKARLKARQLDRINCATTEQSAEISPVRRTIEVFMNGELMAFVDLEGASAGGQPAKPLVLPVSPQPREPAFAVVPARLGAAGCYAVSKVRGKAAGKKIAVSFASKAAEGCAEESEQAQLLVPLGPLAKGAYALLVGKQSTGFGVGQAPPPATAEEPEDEPEAEPSVATTATDPRAEEAEEPAAEEPAAAAAAPAPRDDAAEEEPAARAASAPAESGSDEDEGEDDEDVPSLADGDPAPATAAAQPTAKAAPKRPTIDLPSNIDVY